MFHKTTAAPLALLLAAASAPAFPPAFAQPQDAATTLPTVEILGRKTDDLPGDPLSVYVGLEWRY